MDIDALRVLERCPLTLQASRDSSSWGYRCLLGSSHLSGLPPIRALACDPLRYTASHVCLRISRWEHIVLGMTKPRLIFFFFYRGPDNKYFRPLELYNSCGNYSPRDGKGTTVIDNT